MLSRRVLLTLLLTWQSAGLGQEYRLAQASEHRVTIFALLTKFALSNKVPMGVVLDEKDTLCSQADQPRSSSSSTNVSALKVILASNHYSIKQMESGSGYLIFPEKLSQKQEEILALKITRFDPPPATLHTLGAFLDGQIQMTLHPEHGFAGMIPSSLDAQKIRLVIEDKPVEEVSNSIVSTGGRGLWIMPYLSPLSAGTSNLVQIYGYEEDAETISQMQCSTVK